MCSRRCGVPGGGYGHTRKSRRNWVDRTSNTPTPPNGLAERLCSRRRPWFRLEMARHRPLGRRLRPRDRGSCLPLMGPEGGDAADGVGGEPPSPCRCGKRDVPSAPRYGQHRQHEGDLARLGGLGRHVHGAKGSQGQGDAVGHGEGRDGLHQPPHARHQQQQAEHEQEVIGAFQNVHETRCTRR